jgi:hypothetical protein
VIVLSRTRNLLDGRFLELGKKLHMELVLFAVMGQFFEFVVNRLILVVPDVLGADVKSSPSLGEGTFVMRFRCDIHDEKFSEGSNRIN